MYLLQCFRSLKNATILLQKYSRTNAARNFNFSSSFNNKVENGDKNCNASTTWNRIYYFPRINAARLLNRFKLYQTFFMMACVPTSIYMYNNGLVDLSTVQFISGSAIFASITLFLITSYFRRLIGIICISEDENFVKISHLTFWGRRNDLVISLEDIIPLTDCDCRPNDIYVKLKRYSTDDILYFTLRYGKVIDKTKFEQVFGSSEINIK